MLEKKSIVTVKCSDIMSDQNVKLAGHIPNLVTVISSSGVEMVEMTCSLEPPTFRIRLSWLVSIV